MTESDQRVDEVDKYYRPVKNLDYLSNILFYIGATLSISIPFLTKEQALISSIIPVIFIVSVLLHAFVVSANSYYFIPFAERQRRRQLLSNSLAVPLSFEETNKYYNNKLDPAMLATPS